MSYYRGDYYRGDPGLFKFLGRALGKVVGVASQVLPGPVGLAARGAASVIERVTGAAGKLGVHGIGQFTPSVIPRMPVLTVAPVPGAVPQGRAAGIVRGTLRRKGPKMRAPRGSKTLRGRRQVAHRSMSPAIRAHNLAAHATTMQRLYGGNH